MKYVAGGTVGMISLVAFYEIYSEVKSHPLAIFAILIAILGAILLHCAALAVTFRAPPGGATTDNQALGTFVLSYVSFLALGLFLVINSL